MVNEIESYKTSPAYGKDPIQLAWMVNEIDGYRARSAYPQQERPSPQESFPAFQRRQRRRWKAGKEKTVMEAGPDVAKKVMFHRASRWHPKSKTPDLFGP